MHRAIPVHLFFIYMKKFLPLAVLCFLLFSCGGNIDPDPEPKPRPTPVITGGESDISYQLLVYSFCDSDGDGIGDFNGISSKLDYLKGLGVRAIWLSPIHPATSYHGYDVEDYNAINRKYGTEADFQSLLNAAHSKDMKIYLDFVLNHTSRAHPWFIEGKMNPNSKYRDYYHFSQTQKSGYSSTVSGTDPGRINVRFTLKCSSDGTPQTLRADRVETSANDGTPGSGKYLWYGSVTESTMPEFYSNGNNTYTLSIEDFESSWGILVRTSKTEWGTRKFGAVNDSDRTLVWGVPLNLKSNSDNDILMPWMKPIWYQSVFGEYMPDLNYGPSSNCENSDAFKEVCAAADKWINMGVDGFRLDAVKHIYDSETSDENPTFLKKFYDHCNATYKAAGHSGDIYMVGEQWNEPELVTPYYKGLNAFFEFAFWWRLTEAINAGRGSGFAATIDGYHQKYTAVRSDAIAATKLTNHDEDRAASTIGRNQSKLKLAAAVLLTAGGEPYIYQGEELGYWGTKANGDEYVRTPMMWTSDISSAACGDLGGRVDKSMLTASISVESQTTDESSLLNVYRRFGILRDSYSALAKGSFKEKNGIGKTAVGAWYREYDGQKILVIHNFSAATITFEISGDDLATMIGSNGTVTVNGSSLTLGGYSSALFLQ